MLILFFILLIILIINPDIATSSVTQTTNIFINKLVPILYPNFIIIDFISNDDKIELIARYLYKPFNKLFKINYVNSIPIILLSFICGMPSTAKMINNSITNNQIDEDEGFSILTSFGFFSISYEIILFNKFNINYLPFLLLKILFSIIFMRILNEKKHAKTIYKDFLNNKRELLDCLFSSIKKNLDVLMSILGIMILFNILLSLFNTPSILYVFFEPLNGHNLLLTENINKKLIDFIFLFSMSFLGISIHLQIIYIYQNVKYIKYLFLIVIKALLISFIFFIT